MNAHDPLSAKQADILDAAMQAFAAHGYRRCAMDDIARQAGMSRSALYLHYRNKEDIFRHLVERFMSEAVTGIEAALARPGLTVEAALAAGFAAKDSTLIEMIFTSPHGDELMEAGFTIAADLIRAAEARKIAALAAWVASLNPPEDIGPPEAVARTILTAAMGLKFPGQTLEGYRQGQQHLASLFARALAR